MSRARQPRQPRQQYAPLSGPAPDSLPYTRDRLAMWFGPTTYGRALDYVRRVHTIEWLAGRLYSQVKGGAPSPYVVEIAFWGGQPSGSCTCPVGAQCKHVVATLLACLEEQKQTSDNGLSFPVEQWLASFRTKVARTNEAHAKAAKAAKAPGATYRIVYVMTPAVSEHGMMALSMLKARLGIDGTIRAVDRWTPNYSPMSAPPRFVDEQDDAIVRAFRSIPGAAQNRFPLEGRKGALVWQMIVATGKLFYQVDSRDMSFDTPLREGATRRGDIEWLPYKDDFILPSLETAPGCNVVLPTEPPWYIDIATNETGSIDIPIPPALLVEYLDMPVMTREEAAIVGAAIQEFAPELPAPPADGESEMRVINVEPQAVLTLDTLTLDAPRKVSSAATELDIARLEFDYGEITIAANSPEVLVKLADGDTVRIRRHEELERACIGLLRQMDLQPLSDTPASRQQSPHAGGFFLPSRDAWAGFIERHVPMLRDADWRVVITPNSRFDVVEVTEIDGTAHGNGDGWFDLALGITVEATPIRLEPLLAELFRRDRRWLDGNLSSIPDAEAIHFATDTGRRFTVRADRLKPLVATLLDMFDDRTIDIDIDNPLRLPALEAGRLKVDDSTLRWTFSGDTALLELAQRLRGTRGPRKIAPPRGLKATLRDYQRDGLNWMQFLREQSIGGVLADDMGLGKTVQTLAHIVVEKEAKRLDRPALIVVPTTLVSNWLSEAQRFAPRLKVLDLHGPLRHERFAQIAEHELVITTYPLVWRDHEALAQHDFHLLILDEAQYVKNASGKAAASIRTLRARHRLCLTGTPLENHLGELWSQFDFLLPGFLGSQKDFASRWRRPIEKLGQDARRDLLARRIRPFMLRRRKDEVAKELPAKTTIVRTVELAGAQRDLYETVRAAMQKKVRDAIAKQGFARSHILMLDALLKLRQVCCDPSLVRLAGTKETGESAKLELLSNMLPELIEEGRRVLVFSQFTGMLKIIAAALDEARLAYVTLTGDTVDRQTPVQRFQSGEVPVFLISLKAGGVGLNLTAADTVIHYDPWWNPAAENQATDRAHRIGQDKPVFVYKLIAAGSIEEKIVAMQARKAALAAGILSEDAQASAMFSEADIEALLEPIPDAEPEREAKRPARRQRN